MARKKLSDEEKKSIAKEKAATQLEKNLQNNIKWKIENDHIPPATVFYDVGEKIIFGSHENAEILEIYAEHRVYKIRTYGNYNSYGKLEYREGMYIVSWLDIKKFRTEEQNSIIPVFSKKDDLNLQYYQSDISGLLNTHYNAGIDLEPDYQRGLIWTMEDKISLLDSIFNNIEIGKFVLIKTENCNTFYYEMLDGKQRLTAIADFYENKYQYRGMYYKDLNWKDQNHFKQCTIAIANLHKNITQKQKYAYFLKVNTTGKVVDKEHLDYVRKLLGEI